MIRHSERNEESPNKICVHCKKNPGANLTNPLFWSGFYDRDLQQLSCWNCYDKHYKKKSLTEHAGKITEFPVYLIGRN